MASVTSASSEIINIDEPNLPENSELELNTFRSAAEMVATARSAYNSGRTKPVQFRRAQLKNLLLLFEENSDVIENALYRDLKRSPKESAVFETFYIKSAITKALMNLDDWIKPAKPVKPMLHLLDKLKICNDSLGVVLIISSWNFPIQILFAPLIGAIAAGNCAILKPSEIVRECESVVAKLVPKYLDKECYQVYVGDVEKMSELLAERFDHIFFTGSTLVGRIIHQAANKYLTPVTLELGGKCPTYIDDSVNMHVAMRRILWAKCANAGQICIGPDYLLCTKDVQNKIIPLAKKVLREFFGDDIQSSPDYCRIVSDNHFKRLVKFLNKTENIAMGGKIDESQRFIEPTILVNVSFNDPIMQEEIFGPILPIITVKNPNEAVNFINSGEKPLNMHIFTLVEEVKELFLNSTSSGMVTINDTVGGFIVDTLPFGGVGFSGMGTYHGKFSYDTFVHKKSVYETDFMSLVDKVVSLRYPPYSIKKRQAMNIVLKPRNEKIFQHFSSFLIFIAGVVCAVMIKVIFNAIKK